MHCNTSRSDKPSFIIFLTRGVAAQHLLEKQPLSSDRKTKKTAVGAFSVFDTEVYIYIEVDSYLCIDRYKVIQQRD